MERPMSGGARLRGVAASLVALSVIALTTTPVRADNFGHIANLIYFAQNSHHTLYDESLTTTWHSATDHGKSVLAATDMTTAWVSYHDADVAFYLANRGDAGYLGVYDCIYTVSGQLTVCEHAHITYKSYYYTTWVEKKSTTCHEIGHSVGLHHDNTRDTCLRSDELFPLDYSQHDKNHINGRY